MPTQFIKTAHLQRRLITAENTNRRACHSVHTTVRQLRVTLCSILAQRWTSAVPISVYPVQSAVLRQVLTF